MPVPHIAAQSRPDKTMWAIGIMVETHFQRDQSILAQIDALLNLMSIPIPKMQSAAILPCRYIIQVEALREGVGRSPFTTHHRVQPRLIPEIVVILHPLGLVLPSPGNIKLLVEQ